MKYTVVEFTIGNYQKWESQLTSEYKTYLQKEVVLFNNSHQDSQILEIDDSKVNIEAIVKKENIRSYLILSGTELLGFAVFSIDPGDDSYSPLITLHHFYVKPDTLEDEEVVDCIKRIINKVHSSWGQYNVDFKINTMNSKIINLFLESGFIRTEITLTSINKEDR